MENNCTKIFATHNPKLYNILKVLELLKRFCFISIPDGMIAKVGDKLSVLLLYIYL